MEIAKNILWRRKKQGNYLMKCFTLECNDWKLQGLMMRKTSEQLEKIYSVVYIMMMADCQSLITQGFKVKRRGVSAMKAR